MHTHTGGGLTLAILVMILMYGGIRFGQMMTKHNPNINDYFVDNEIRE